MYCSKCGKEIADEAIICPICGCATANYHQPFTIHSTPPQSNGTYSQDYIVLKEFEEKVKSIYATSIVALVLFLGIGLIFSIVVWLKAKDISIPNITTTNPNEIAMFESLKRKLKKALLYANIPLCAFMLLAAAFLFAQKVGAAALVFVVYFAILFLIGMPCTKHLNKDLYGSNK